MCLQLVSAAVRGKRNQLILSFKAIYQHKVIQLWIMDTPL